MNYNIQQIKIVLKTNIQSQPEVVLDSSILYHPEEKIEYASLNKYPFFTFDFKYSYSKLNSFSYADRVKFFFDRKFFEKTLDILKTIEPADDDDGGDDAEFNVDDNIDGLEKIEQENIESNKIMKKNVMTMLKVLFPTRFPAINNIQNSTDIVLRGSSKFKDMWFKPLHYATHQTAYFSYLKIGGQVYTSARLIWLNDFLNHPKYRELLESYMSFYNAIQREKKEKIYSLQRQKSKAKSEEDKNVADTQIEKYNELYNDDGVIFNQTFKKINNNPEYSSILLNNAAYRDFNNSILPRYRKATRFTENIKLQNIINMESDEDTSEFYKFMNFLKEYYIKPSGGNSKSKHYKPYMNVSVCDININSTDSSLPKFEIYVMMDLIEGVLNSANMSSVKCAFEDKNIGSMLEDILDKTFYYSKKTSEPWNVTKNRFLFSINEMNKTKINDTDIPSDQREYALHVNRGDGLRQPREPDARMDEDRKMKNENAAREITELFERFIKDGGKNQDIDLKNSDITANISMYEQNISRLKESPLSIQNIFVFLSDPKNYRDDSDYENFFDLLKEFNEIYKKNGRFIFSKKIYDRFVDFQYRFTRKRDTITISDREDVATQNKKRLDQSIYNVLANVAEIFIKRAITIEQTTQGGCGKRVTKRRKNGNKRRTMRANV